MTYARLIRANLGRNRLRTVFTGTAMMLAVALVCLLLTMPSGLNAILEDATSNVRISVHNKAGLVYSMPQSFTRKVRALPGVAAAVSFTWFGGAFEEDGKVTFPNFAVESEHVGAVYPDYSIAPEQLAAFQRYRDGVLVGRQVMQKYKWKIGDRITLRSTVWPVDLDLRIVGEMADERIPVVWLNREYLDQALRAKGWANGLGITGTVWVRADSPESVGAIMQKVDEMSRNSPAETASETEKSFFSNFFGSLKGLVQIVLVVTGLVTLCIVFIAANTASMGVRERAAEIAVMKALGFRRAPLFASLLAETLLLSTVAGGLGVLTAFGLTRGLRTISGWSDALGPLGNFTVTPGVIAQGLLISLVVGLLAGIVPAAAAARKPVNEALREVF